MTDPRKQVDAAQLTTVPPDAVLQTGRRLDAGYLCEKVIGEGAAGRVWRGRRGGDAMPVAIKVLHPQYSDDADIVTRFVREHVTLKKLDHPHLVRVVDLVCVGDILAIVMELVEGENLRKAAAGGGIDPGRAATVLSHMADALAYIHAAGIVHRDVKPENMLVTWRSGAPWTQLTDFGVAHVAGGLTLTRVGEIVGTPAYVAPEIVMNRPAGAPADVYALGVTAYELLAGRRPFVADHPLALLRAHVDDEPERPAAVSDAAWSVVRACLAKDPADRPAAAELSTRFADLPGRLGLLPATAPPPEPPLVREAMPTFLPAPRRTTPSSEPAGAPEEDAPDADLVPTTGATRPAPDPPVTAAPSRRRWIWYVAGAMAVLLAAWMAGLWAGRPDDPAPQASSAATAQVWFLPVTAISPARGTVRLDFADASRLPGFDSYVIFLDGARYAQVLPGKAPPYVVTGRHTGTRNCYRVAALVITDLPKPPDAPSTCLAADGTNAPAAAATN